MTSGVVLGGVVGVLGLALGAVELLVGMSVRLLVELFGVEGVKLVVGEKENGPLMGEVGLLTVIAV